MSSEIKNVPIEEASIGATLPTTGIYTCIAVLIILDDDRTFIFYSDPSCIDLENKVTPILDGLNVDELQNFVKCIMCCNTIFNPDGGDADAVQGNVLISDTTILVDLKVSPPLLFRAQYYDLEKNLYGVRRRIEPHFFLIYKFNSKSWNIIKNQLSAFQPAHMNAILDQFNHNLLVDDVQYTKDQLMNYLSKIQH